jgi:hypothetical protein
VTPSSYEVPREGKFIEASKDDIDISDVEELVCEVK